MGTMFSEGKGNHSWQQVMGVWKLTAYAGEECRGYDRRQNEQERSAEDLTEVCAGEECREYDNGQYVKRRTAEGMWQAVCAGEDCWKFDDG